ncbi:hypothetical protein Tco_1200798 [Tanacetum coccineum]
MGGDRMLRCSEILEVGDGGREVEIGSEGGGDALFFKGVFADGDEAVEGDVFWVWLWRGEGEGEGWWVEYIMLMVDDGLGDGKGKDRMDLGVVGLWGGIIGMRGYVWKFGMRGNVGYGWRDWDRTRFGEGAKD